MKRSDIVLPNRLCKISKTLIISMKYYWPVFTESANKTSQIAYPMSKRSQFCKACLKITEAFDPMESGHS